jgi:hypothetical protein
MDALGVREGGLHSYCAYWYQIVPCGIIVGSAELLVVGRQKAANLVASV